jgi:hypothetical protein
MFCVATPTHAQTNKQTHKAKQNKTRPNKQTTKQANKQTDNHMRVPTQILHTQHPVTHTALSRITLSLTPVLHIRQYLSHARHLSHGTL